MAGQGQFGGGKSISTELVSVEIVFGPAPGLCCSNLRDVGAMLGLCCAYVGLYWTIWRLCLRLFQLFLNYFFALKIMKFSAKEFGLEWCRLSHFAGCSAYVGGC